MITGSPLAQMVLKCELEKNDQDILMPSTGKLT